MGKPRVVHRRLTLLLAAALAGCGGDAPLLSTADPQETVYGSGGAAGSVAQPQANTSRDRQNGSLADDMSARLVLVFD